MNERPLTSREEALIWFAWAVALFFWCFGVVSFLIWIWP